MTQEEKQLLLVDLSARLPYGVKVRYSSYDRFITCTLHSINPVYNIVDLWSKDACFNPVIIDKIKPYLFPLSSMTEAQRSEYEELYLKHNYLYGADSKYMVQTWKIDWCNRNHFDYRGLIPMGLANDATGLNIY